MTCGARPRAPRRSPAAWLFLLLIVVLTGCGARPVVLTGKITDAYTGAPVPQASVVVGNTTVTTDANGVFSTPSWRKTDTLAVSAPNYEVLSLPLEGRPELAASDALTITLDTSLRPNTISGTITDAYTGKPLPGAQIVATYAATSTLSATTDDTGRYSLTSLPEQFTLGVSAPGYTTVEQDLRQTTSLDLSLRPNVLAGKVTDRFSGQGVAGAKVAVGAAS
ncbi:MAG: carboxypeptidase-like regulatory domain-containing protein, partial [Chloroflexales bacterium]|nr:carboxypeptidase-like regulatory domain-containing protein [Chloroflexales bacterium]